MNANLRLVIVLHNHQPIGNFDGVFEHAYQDSYRPFSTYSKITPTYRSPCTPAAR